MQNYNADELSLVGNQFIKEKEYWVKKLSGELERSALPYDHPGFGSLEFAADRIGFEFTEEICASLLKLAGNSDIKLHMILMTGVAILLHKYTGNEDIIVGTSIYKQDTDGPFINSVLAIRSQLNANTTFKELLSQVRLNLIEAVEHQNYPIEELLNKVDIPPVEQGFSLFDVTVQVLNIQEKRYLDRVKTNAAFFFSRNGDHIAGELGYNSGLYQKDSIERFRRHLSKVLGEVLQNINLPIGDLDILTEAEKDQLLYGFNNTAAEYPQEKTIQQLFEEQVARTPENSALVFEGESLTYRQLNARANQLAVVLREKGVKPETIVALITERSLEMAVVILGILKAGGAYLPIDPGLPEERVAFLLADSGAGMVVKQAHLEPHIGQFQGTILNIENNVSHAGETNNLTGVNEPQNLAYVIYTSGTTSRPKGVKIEHHSLTNAIWWRKNEYHLDEKDKVLQLFSYAFDGFLTSFLTPIISGSCVFMLNEMDAIDQKAIRDVVVKHKITHFICISQLYNGILDFMTPEDAKSLRIITLAGDKTLPQTINKSKTLNPHLELVNEYGPTEATIVATIFRNMGPADGNIIGKPIDNTRIYILNHEGQLQPVGIPGELCIAGVGVAREYINQAELNMTKFVPNPFVPVDASQNSVVPVGASRETRIQRMYKTGDLAKWLPDGNIEFLGRIDHQVKIRGFRVELGEIETRLMQFEAVKEAVVVDKEDHNGNKYLCAYVVFVENTHACSLLELRAHLMMELPEYMIPSYFVYFKKIPLTTSGKIDRRALPAPEGNIDTGVAYEAPRNDIERKLAAVWQEVLGMAQVGINDNFFELGGHSLKATELIAKIHKAINRELPLREVFQLPTIRGQAAYLQETSENPYETIQPASCEEGYPERCYPVSSAQKRLYILRQMEADPTSYNMPGAVAIEGEIKPERLKEVFQRLIERHESLRTSFELIAGEPAQRIQPGVEFKLEYWQAKETEINQIISKFVRPFDLGQAPLLRAGLIETGPGKSILIYDMHHIIADGTSMGILIDEFVDLYEGKDLTPLRIQYKDYAGWQREQLQSGFIKSQEAYWLKQFAGELPVLNLSTDYPRPSVQTFAGNRYEFELEAELTGGLKRIAAENGATLFMVLLAAYNVLLTKYSGQEDIIIGTPIAGRPHADLEHIIGMFVNTLALRDRPEGAKSFAGFLNEVKEHALQAYENQDYQFETLVEKLNLRRDFSRNPIFDVMFTLQNIEINSKPLTGLRITPYPTENLTAKFDLTVHAAETGAKLNMDIEYCAGLFKPETAARMAGHLRNILQAIVNDPRQKLEEIEITSEAEKRQILYEFNNTAAAYPKNKTVQQMFEEQAERTPDQIAVIFEDGQLTYRELNIKANQLAHVLRGKGIRPNQLVAIIVDRSFEMIIGLMGILKSGGGYLPIDPGYPRERVRYILEDSNVEIILTTKTNDAGIDPGTAAMVYLDEAANYTGDYQNPETINQVKDIAYCIYTSGSTGTPKGVLIENQSLVNRLHWMQKEYPINSTDRILQKTPYTFDVSLWELFWWSFTGATVTLLVKGGEKEPETIITAIENNKITTIHFVPSMLTAFLDYVEGSNSAGRIKSLRQVFASGEALTVKQVERFHKIIGGQNQTKLHNLYGPTEATVDVSYYECASDRKDTVPIGKPIDNINLYIVDGYNNLQPIGVPGELCIAGDGLARGYLNRPELTAEKFVPNPFALIGAPQGTRLQSFNELLHTSHFTLHTSIIYRTGDYARWLPDGNIEYLGRIDHQVKIRGFRIELGEIEACLLQHETVKEAVTIAREDSDGNKFLCAYLVGDREQTVPELREYLSRTLPEYMIPSYFVYLDKMPVTPNGKIDRKALPEPEGNIHTGVTYEAPRNDIEKKLAELWRVVLGIERAGIHDNFFYLGGDSIKSLQISAGLYKQGLKLEIRDLFQYPTIGELSEHVTTINQAIDQGIVTGEAALTPVQRWFFSEHRTGCHHFNQSILISKEAGFDQKILREVLAAIIAHHDALRMIFRSENGAIKQYNRDIDAKLYDLEIIDLSNQADVRETIETQTQRMQQSINLGQGPLVKTGLFKTATVDYLLIIIHHLVVDGVSWRIILEDLTIGYDQSLKGEHIQLAAKTHSYQEWARRLAAYGNSSKIEAELTFWLALEAQEVAPLKKDHRIEYRQFKDNDSQTMILPEAETDRMLKESNRAYNTEINDLLLTALGMTIKDWNQTDKVLLNLEGHGREEIIDGINILRTVGWFTTIYPVLLDMSNQDLGYRIKNIKESLRRIPNKGIGYGILKYLRDGLSDSFRRQPEISFNYLGQFDRELNTSLFKAAEFNPGFNIAPDIEQQYALDINGVIMNGRLSLTFSYNRYEYEPETIAGLIERFRNNLLSIITHCAAKKEQEATPSDFNNEVLSIDEVAQLTNFFKNL